MDGVHVGERRSAILPQFLQPPLSGIFRFTPDILVFNIVATILPFRQTFPLIQASMEWHQIKVFLYLKYTNFGSHFSWQCNMIIISFKTSADVWIYLFHKWSISSKTEIEIQQKEQDNKLVLSINRTVLNCFLSVILPWF